MWPIKRETFVLVVSDDRSLDTMRGHERQAYTYECITPSPTHVHVYVVIIFCWYLSFPLLSQARFGLVLEPAVCVHVGCAASWQTPKL